MIVFIPRKLKYKKFQKSKGYHDKCFKKFIPQLGSFGLKAKIAFLLNFKHIEMFRILLVRQLKSYIKKTKDKNKCTSNGSNFKESKWFTNGERKSFY